MIKINKLKWATCPECGIELNTWTAYPATVFMMNEIKYPQVAKCISCDAPIAFQCKVNMKITAKSLKKVNNERLGEG